MLLLMLALATGAPEVCNNNDFWMESIPCDTHCAYLEMGYECADNAVEKLQCECPGLLEKDGEIVSFKKAI